MKTGDEAVRQYGELANALIELDAEWVTAEVEDEISRGKTIQFRDVPPETQEAFVQRLYQEEAKGVALKKPRASERVGVPYAPEEQLALLVDASRRVLTATVRAAIFMTKFATTHDLDSVAFEEPERVGSSSGDGGRPTSVQQRREATLLSEDAASSLLTLGQVLDRVAE